MGSRTPPPAASRARCRCAATARKCGDRSSAAMLRAPGNASRSSSVDSPASHQRQLRCATCAHSHVQRGNAWLLRMHALT